MDPTVADPPSGDEYGSVERRVDQLMPHANYERELFAKAFGIIQVIGEQQDMPGTVRVRLARNVLTAAERVRMTVEPPHPSWPTEAELKPWETLAPREVAIAESMTPIADDGPITVYFAFGWGQHDPGTGKHLIDHYVTITGPSFDACVETMRASRYGDRYATEYTAGDPGVADWIGSWTEHDRLTCPPAEKPARTAEQLADDVRAVS